MYEHHYLGLWIIWPYAWPQNKCRSLWPIFHGQVISPYILKTNRCMNIIIWDYKSVWRKVWPQNKYRTLWPIFHDPVILRYILNTIWCMNIILWDYGSVWPDVWPKNKWSIRPIFHGPVILSYLLDYLMILPYTSDFALYLEYYLMYEHHQTC